MRRWSRSIRSARDSTTQTVSPRGLSTRAIPTGVASQRCGRPGSIGSASSSASSSSVTTELQRADLDPRPDVAARSRRHGRGEIGAVPEAGALAAAVRRDPGRPRSRADRAEHRRVGGTEHADVVEAGLDRGGEGELAPGAHRVRAELAQLAPERVRARRRHLRPARADGDRAEEEAMADEALVQAQRPLLERGEGHVARGEADPGADLGEVVQVVVEALQLQQQGAAAAGFAVGHQPQRRFRRQRVGDRVGDRAGAAGALGEGERGDRLRPRGGPLEPAVLVEEARIEVEDALADDVEAEVPRLDHPGVDRADRDLEGPLPRHRHGPARGLPGVVDERSQRVTALELDPLEVVGLALVPVGGREQVDDRGDRPALDDRGAEEAGRGAVREEGVPAPVVAVAGGVGAAEAAAAVELVEAVLAPARERTCGAARSPGAVGVADPEELIRRLRVRPSTRPEPGSR